MRVAGRRSVSRISSVTRFCQAPGLRHCANGDDRHADREGRTQPAPVGVGSAGIVDQADFRRPRFAARSRASRPPVPVIEFRRSAAYPADEGGDVGVFAQSLRRGVVTRQFVLAQYGVQLAVADAMHQNRDTTALRLRYQMVLIHH